MPTARQCWLPTNQHCVLLCACPVPTLLLACARAGSEVANQLCVLPCACLPAGIEVANQGQIRFVRKGRLVTGITLTISYQLPDVLVPFANVRGLGGRAWLHANGW